jgi:hypothetical protein
VDYQHWISSQSSKVKSMIASIPSIGSHSIKGLSEVISGFVETNESESVLTIGSNRTFIADAHFVVFATPPVTASPVVTATRVFTIPLQSMFIRRSCTIWKLGKFVMPALVFSFF